MNTLTVRPSTIQIVGTLISIFVGVIAGYLLSHKQPQVGVAAGLAFTMLGEILTVTLDISYGALGEGRAFQDSLRANPVLKRYEDCVRNYNLAKDAFHKLGDMEIGALLSSWLDERISRHTAESDEDWGHGRISFPQDQVASRSVQLLRRVKATGFATQLERVAAFWEMEEAREYLEDTRALANRPGSKVDLVRVFILNSLDSLRNESLISQIREDTEAGITIKIVLANRISPDCHKDFGIYDEKFLSQVHMTGGGRVTGCTYSVREDDLDRARGWREEILQRAQDPPQDITSPGRQS